MDSTGEYGQPFLRTTALDVPVISNSGTVTVGGIRSGNMLLYDGTYATPGTVPNDGPYTTTKGTCTGRMRVANVQPLKFTGTNYAPEEYRTQVQAVNVGSTPFSFDLCQTDDYGVSGARKILKSFSLVPMGQQSVSVIPSARYLEIWGVNGSGNLRVQFSSKATWDRIAFSKDDPTTPPILSRTSNVEAFNALASGGSTGNPATN